MRPSLAKLGWMVCGLLVVTGMAAPHGAVVSTMEPGFPDLAGRWRFQLDPQDVGIAEGWMGRKLAGEVTLPGSLPAQGIGEPVGIDTKWMGDIVDKSWYTAARFAPYRQPGNVKLPFWLTPEKYYAGAAWYQREVEIPRGWLGRRVVLALERPHWETRVWVDDQFVGTNNALGTPHEYDLGQVTPGKHTLTVRVDNRLIVDVGVNSHSISDHTQGNWNGIVGRIELRTTPLVWIEDVQIFPEAANGLVRVRAHLRKEAAEAASGRVRVELEPARGAPPFKDQPAGGESFLLNCPEVTVEVLLATHGQAKTWDSFSPVLYKVRIKIDGQIGPGEFEAERSMVVGFRELKTSGTQFVLNERKLFFRGTLDCCVYPRTGHPPTDVESWKRTIRICQAHGLNLIRFHSWCPPEAAFSAADELGFYFQVEASSWANQSTTLGDGRPVDDWIYAETDRILKYYGNHPSFLLMAYGNEPGGREEERYLARWVSHYRAQDSRRLWTGAAGWPQIAENQFDLTPDPRIQGWGQGVKSRINAQPPETVTDYRNDIQRHSVPVISHEIGQWCAYPNFGEMRKYSGYLKPRNFEIFQESLRAHHLGDLAHRFLLASGKLQTICYKEEIESALRTAGMGGFELLDLHDFPGQGTALVGVLDPFWEDKGYVTAKEFQRFCGDTVLLARLSKRVFTSDEPLVAELEVAHFGSDPIEHAAATWALVGEDGGVAARGECEPRTLPVDNGIALGRVAIDLTHAPAPARYRLVVRLPAARTENDWDVWVYPRSVDVAVPPGVTVVRALDERAISRLRAGGTVLCMLPPLRVAPDPEFGPVALGFSPIFWNTAWTQRQPPHTLGVLLDPRHPLFAEFPTEFHSNWQWWYVISHAGAMLLDRMPAQLRPTIEVIDDWTTNRKLGLLFEAKLDGGNLAVCSIDLEHDLEHDPVRRQFRRSLLRYLSGPRFKPTQSITLEQARSVLAR